jgi:hypothetical protein
MTYHALENRLRKWKKEATALKDEAADVAAPAKSPAKPRVKKDASPQKGGESYFALCEKFQQTLRWNADWM